MIARGLALSKNFGNNTRPHDLALIRKALLYQPVKAKHHICKQRSHSNLKSRKCHGGIFGYR